MVLVCLALGRVDRCHGRPRLRMQARPMGDCYVQRQMQRRLVLVRVSSGHGILLHQVSSVAGGVVVVVRGLCVPVHMLPATRLRGPDGHGVGRRKVCVVRVLAR